MGSIDRALTTAPRSEIICHVPKSHIDTESGQSAVLLRGTFAGPFKYLSGQRQEVAECKDFIPSSQHNIGLEPLVKLHVYVYGYMYIGPSCVYMRSVQLSEVLTLGCT
jgi:hypothetical protein